MTLIFKDKKYDLELFYDMNLKQWLFVNVALNERKSFNDTGNYSWFLKYLYINPDEIVESLKSKISDEYILKNALETFPISNVVIFLLNQHLYFWLELSIKWLEKFGIKETLIKTLKIFVKDVNHPQKLRHLMASLLKKKSVQ